ncbi:hypothetical protein L3Q65_03220 [Amycolatopsis sp. FU40]|uniref:hypothetical protein n=1 Tax=Amycolatopsis sp. FU40 TaxID=2914159 RepID=UPI001F158C8E|nr:hypothetical protein [Amycolatopsis sp. FU40]UKD55746.1 hypothetical protein L3Q65_03220 [Amycolatopsis sp. FU40]
MAGNRVLAWAGAIAAVGGGVGLALPTAHYLPSHLPLGGTEPDLDLGLRLACAGALALAFALAILTLRRRQAEPLAFTALTGIAVAGILLRYLVITLPSANRLAPSADVQPAAGAWVLLTAGLVLAATGLIAAANAQRGR